MKIKTRRYYIYYCAKILFFLISLLPLRVSQAIAGRAGRAAFRFVPKYRDITLANLNAVFNGGGRSNEKIAGEVFASVAKNGAEWIKLSLADPGKIGDLVTEFEGAEHLDSVLAEGKGAVILGFHFGNWELLGLYLRHMGYDGALIARRIYFHKYDKLITGMRTRYGARVIYRDDSPKKMLKELRNGNVLGILADQDVDSVDGVFVDFFGKPAYTPTAPVKIAMAAGTKIVPAFVLRKKDNTHKLILEKPIDPSLGDHTEDDIRRYTQAWTDILENYVRKYPEQWVWMHSRWKSRPASEACETSEVAGSR
ncbi:MAG: lysophospholipid acyltransferase family protein [Candidatus Omnitrophota bacterium]